MAKHKRVQKQGSYNRQMSRMGRGMTLSPSRPVGPRGVRARPSRGTPLPPKGLAAKAAHIIGTTFIPPGGKAEIKLVPKEYPYFTAYAANVVSNVNIITRAYVGAKAVQILVMGSQKLDWPPGSTTGLGREVRVIIHNPSGTTAKVKIDLSVMPMDHL